MKKVLSIIAAALTVVLVFTSCHKDPTRTDILTNEKGWTLSALTCPEGYGANAVTDIYAMLDNAGGYECDDVMKFNADGKESVNAGTKKYDYEGEGDQYVGTWAFNDEETVLECQIPVFGPAVSDPEGTLYSAAKEQCNIISMEKEKMVLSHTFTPGSNPAKAGFGQEGTWTFQFTYVLAK